MESVIRLASSTDCSHIAAIYNQYLGIATMDLEVKDASYYQNILRKQDDMEELWVLEVDRILAWGIIKKYSDRAGYRLTGETSVYCHPHFLNKGYGSSLKKHLMQRCKDLGYHHLLARINANNKVSIHYNKKLGYTMVGIQKEAGFVNGSWKDIAIMQYIIEQG